MKIIKLKPIPIFIVLLIIHYSLFIVHCSGQTTRYWVGGNGNFTNGSFWSLTSGGSPIGGTIAWTTSDTAVFDTYATSPNVTTTSAQSIGGLIIKASQKTITLMPAATFTINGNLTVVAGTLNLYISLNTYVFTVKGTTTLATSATPPSTTATFTLSGVPSVNNTSESGFFILGPLVINDFTASSGGKGLYNVTAYTSGFDYLFIKGSITNNSDASAFQPAVNVNSAGSINYVFINSTGKTNYFKGPITFNKTWLMFNGGDWENDGTFNATNTNAFQLGSGKFTNTGNFYSTCALSTSGCASSGGTIINTSTGYLAFPGAGCSNSVYADFSAIGNTVEYNGNGYFMASTYTNTNPVYPTLPNNSSQHYNVIISGNPYFGGTNQSITINGSLQTTNNGGISICGTNCYMIISGTFTGNDIMFYGCGSSSAPPPNTTLLINSSATGNIGTMVWGGYNPIAVRLRI